MSTEWITKMAPSEIFLYQAKLTSRTNVDSACDGSIMKKDNGLSLFNPGEFGIYSAFWPTERTSVQKVVGIHDVDLLIAISAQLTALLKKLNK